MRDDDGQDWEKARNNLYEMRRELNGFNKQLEEASERTKAVSTVLNALIASLRPYGYNRKHFNRLIRLASADIPNSGPASVQHELLLANARKVLDKQVTGS
ncbi:hypothetical protein [Methylobacterium mesophilicum]